MALNLQSKSNAHKLYFMEPTEKEKQLLREGITFSTNIPAPMFIKDGMEGGNYVGYAYQADYNLNIQIFDLSLSTTTKQISINKEEVDHISIHLSIYQNEDNNIWQTEVRYDPIKLHFSHGVTIGCTEHDTKDWSKPLTIHSDKYQGLSLDTQAKLFFLDLLKIYLEEKAAQDRETKAITETSEDPTTIFEP